MNFRKVSSIGKDAVAEERGSDRRIGAISEAHWSILNQYQGGMCISGVLTMTERTPRHLISPLGPNWVGTDSAV